MHFHYRVTFTGYIRCFRATTSHDLVTLTFELLTLIGLLWRLQSLLRMRSITWPVHKSPPKPHVTIFWPRIAYSLYNVYAATMTIKGSLYLSIPMLKRFSVAKKTKSSQNRSPEMAVFRKFKGSNIEYCHRDRKRHLLTRNDVILRIFRKYPSRGVGCSLIEEPKKRTY